MIKIDGQMSSVHGGSYSKKTHEKNSFLSLYKQYVFKWQDHRRSEIIDQKPELLSTILR